SAVTIPGGGSVASTTPLLNPQVGTTTASNVHELINSTTFYNQTSTRSPQTPDDTVTTAPCTAGMVDVKLTETNLPWFFRALASVPFIDAEARVSLLQQTTDTGSLPVAVNDLNPKT